MLTTLLDRIERRTARVGVIDLGYVGLPLAVAWADAGFEVIGFDIDERRVARCERGESWIADVPAAAVATLTQSGRLRATTDFAALATVDAVSICVPTPLRKTKDPDISAVLSAVETVATHLRPGQLIVLESTTYPSTTDELVLPRLEQSGLRVGTDFFLAFSPERVDPGNTRYTVRNTPKVVGGITLDCRAAIETVVPVSSTRAAELVKLLENTFRAVNIGMANELAIMANLLGVDVWEVIAAAATKPFGFMPFYPSPGLGGHCIPIDPHYLTWKMRTLNYSARFIEIASEINGQMPRYVVELISKALNEARQCINGARVLIIGAAYKRDVSDMRESPALDIIELLRARRAEISYADPYVPALTLSDGATLRAVPLDDEQLAAADCAVIVTDHHAFDYGHIATHARLIVDTRNALAGQSGAHIWRL